MVYLERFALPGQGREEVYLSEIRRTCYDSRYPFGVFRYRPVPPLDFGPVTILYGGNGSGKSTILNVLAEKLGIRRGTACSRSHFFEDYVNLCTVETSFRFTEEVRRRSRILTSDDVFDALLDLRALNEGITQKREELLREYTEKKYAAFQLHSLSDLKELKKHADATRKSGSQYVRQNLMREIPGGSNGESVLRFFTEAIAEDALYLLDEPEASLSPLFQQQLVEFLAQSARFFGCQLVISTHSPFLLAMPGAAVYDLDAQPPRVRKWTELENVRIYRDFFRRYEREFDP